MLARAKRDIAKQIKMPLQTEHPSLVSDRIGQPPVAIMAADEKIEFLSGRPSLRTDLRQPFPSERSFGLGLVLAIHNESVMKARSAKKIPLRPAPCVFAGAGIDQ